MFITKSSKLSRYLDLHENEQIIIRLLYSKFYGIIMKRVRPIITFEDILWFFNFKKIKILNVTSAPNNLTYQKIN